MGKRCSRKLLSCVAACLLGLAGLLLCLVGLGFSAEAQDLRVLQVWPDRSNGVVSGLLEGSTVPTAAQVLPFGVCHTSAGDVVHARTYLHFPLDVFPPGTEVLHAALYVYVDGGSGAGEATLGAYRVLEPWEEGDWGGDPATWPALLPSPIAATTARFDVVTPTLPVSTPVPTAIPTSASTPTLTATETSALFSKPAGHGLVQEGTMVTIDPSNASVALGATTVVNIRVENVANLYGAEVSLTFDSVLLEVVDADPNTEGVQIQPGTFLSPDFIEENIVDQDYGEIDFAISQMEPHESVSGGGVLAMITFRGKAVGQSDIDFEDALLDDYDGEAIWFSIQDGSVTVISGETPEPTSEPTHAPHMPTSTPGPTPASTHTPTPGPTSTSTPTSTPGPTPTPPTSPLPTPTLSPMLTVPVVQLGQAAETWLTWDVTALVRAWLAGEVPDDGLALAPAPDPGAEPETAGGLLVARWLAAADLNTRPHLIVEFEVHPVTPMPTPTSTPTSVPALPSAGNSVGWGPAGLLLVGAALLTLGLIVRRGER